MIYAYPCEFATDDDGTLVVTFPDVPEAITGGQDHPEAMRLAADALAVALAGYVHDQRDIPEPSPTAEDQELVAVPAVAAAKLALYSAMCAQRITKPELARRLGSSASAVDRLTDPDRQSSIAQLQQALDALGRSLKIEVTA